MDSGLRADGQMSLGNGMDEASQAGEAVTGNKPRNAGRLRGENAHRLKPFAAWEAFGDVQLTQTRSGATGHSDQPLPVPKHPSRHKSETAQGLARVPPRCEAPGDERGMNATCSTDTSRGTRTLCFLR